MAEFPSDEALRLDGTIGTFADDAKEASTAIDQRFLRVAVFGDDVSDTDAIGLADDVRLLVQAFIHDHALTERETPPTVPIPGADPDEDVEIALHGLGLGRAEEDKLHRLIRDLVRERLSPGQTTE